MLLILCGLRPECQWARQSPPCTHTIPAMRPRREGRATSRREKAGGSSPHPGPAGEPITHQVEPCLLREQSCLVVSAKKLVLSRSGATGWGGGQKGPRSCAMGWRQRQWAHESGGKSAFWVLIVEPPGQGRSQQCVWVHIIDCLCI